MSLIKSANMNLRGKGHRMSTVIQTSPFLAMFLSSSLALLRCSQARWYTVNFGTIVGSLLAMACDPQRRGAWEASSPDSCSTSPVLVWCKGATAALLWASQPISTAEIKISKEKKKLNQTDNGSFLAPVCISSYSVEAATCRVAIHRFPAKARWPWTCWLSTQLLRTQPQTKPTGPHQLQKAERGD